MQEIKTVAIWTQKPKDQPKPHSKNSKPFCQIKFSSSPGHFKDPFFGFTLITVNEKKTAELQM